MSLSAIFPVPRIASGAFLRLGLWPWKLLLAAVLVISGTAARAAIPASERTALLNLYASTNGVGWFSQTNWGGAAGTECTWYGITCDASGSTVTSIDLSGNYVVGFLPSLAALTHLQTLDLGDGTNDPPIPNIITGSLTALNNLSELQYVDLSNQALYGPLDFTGLTQLVHFNVHNNALSGPIPALSGLKQLVFLELSTNCFPGPMPPLTGLANLNYIDVAGTCLTGSLPSLQGLTNLQQFYANQNYLTGSIPSLNGLTQLNTFDVDYNSLDGTLPASFSGLPNLQTLSAFGNHLTGSIPELSQLSNLQGMGFGLNDLTGKIPALSMLTNLQGISFSYNQLTGTVPAPPSTLKAGQSYLCPNLLTAASSPPSASDLAWNTATGSAPWSAACTQTPMATQMTASSGAVSYVGESIPFSAQVYGAHPTGSVNFIDMVYSNSIPSTLLEAKTVCANVSLVNGQASCNGTLSTLQPDEQHQVDVTYSGDANNAPSEGYVFLDSLSYFVNLSSSASAAFVNQPVDLMATVSSFHPATTVSFFDGSTPLCSHVPITYVQHVSATFPASGTQGSVSGQYEAQCSTTFSSASTHSLTAQYDASWPSTPSAPITQTVMPTAPFDADQLALTGSWYHPTTSGQGLLLQVSPDESSAGIGELFGAWFTFDALGNPQWVTLSGNLGSVHGATYALNLYVNTNGNFDASPITKAVADGTATLTFYDCTHAILSYTYNDGRTGSIPQTRVTTPTGCSTTVPAAAPSATLANYNDVLHSGAWYSPTTSGQGLLIDIAPAQNLFFAGWFTYAPQSENMAGLIGQRWLTIQGNYTPGNLTVQNLPIYLTMGGLFNTPSSILTEQIGTANVTFTSCSTMTIQYNFTVPNPNILSEFTGLSGTINEQASSPPATCQ